MTPFAMMFVASRMMDLCLGGLLIVVLLVLLVALIRGIK